MPIHQAFILFGTAIIAGVLNSVAGGGSFVTFPTLLMTGMAPIPANATNTLALWPGTVTSAAAYRSQLSKLKALLLPLGTCSLIGGVAGAWVLLHTPPDTFMRMVPWLMLLATTLLAFSNQASDWIRKAVSSAAKGNASTASDNQEASVGLPSKRVVMLGMLVQIVVATYIGFFGAGAGILMLATMALMGIRDIHAMNGLKVVNASIANGVAVVTFIIARAIHWPQALLMTVAAALGGYLGAWYAQRVHPGIVRWFAILTGAGMTVYFFVRAYV
jgi:uncharacterized membrane protein YfcA